MKNETQKTKEKTYSTNDIGIILERMEKRFDETDRKIENLSSKTDKRFEKMTSELGSMIENLDGKIQILAENIVSIDHRLIRVEQKVDRLQDDMVEVKYELKQKASNEDFKKLEKRVTKLERLSLAH